MADEENGRHHHYRPSYQTKSHLHHEEPAPIAARFTNKRSKDEHKMPSEAT